MERRLAAILAADVVGYSRLMEVDETGTLSRLKAHMSALLAPKIAEHRGHIVKTTGDGLLAEFQSVVEAVLCAVEIQRGMAERTIEEPEAHRILFRIGINIGDIIIEDGDIFGDGVNVAARLEGLAEPGGICVHRDVRSQVQNRVPFAFEDMGLAEVKNIARPLRVYRVVFDGTKPIVAAPRPQWRRKAGKALPATLALAVILSLIATGALVWNGWRVTAEEGASPRVAAISDKPSLAVLPFANRSNDPEQEYFAEGLTDDLITRLGGVSGLFVISRSSVLGYKGKTVKPEDAASDLGVHYILEGSVRKSGDQLRINADLVDTKTGHQLWARQYNGKLADIFALQDEVIGAIVSALTLELTDAEQEHIARVPTSNLEAYDYYLRAETEGYYKLDFDTFGRALAFYRKAIELDPEFADAHAGYARTAAEVWRFDSDQIMPAAVARKRAYEAAGRALALDSRNARAYTVLAILQLSDGRHEEAIQSARRAVDLNPGDAEGWANLGMVLSYAGQDADSVAAIGDALRLSPAAPPGLRMLAGIVFFNARQYEDAAGELEPVTIQWPDAETPHVYLAATYAALGKIDSAKREVAAIPFFSQKNLAFLRLTYAASYRREGDLNDLLDALAKADVPAWPFGFQPHPADRITGSALTALVAERIWTGRIPIGEGKDTHFTLQIDRENRVAYGSANTLLTGLLRVEGDDVCLMFEGYLRDEWLCGGIYRHPDAAAGTTRTDYVYVLPDGLRYFSVKA